MAKSTKYTTTNMCEFVRAILKAADNKAQEKGITKEEQAYYIGIYNTALAIFQGFISKDSECSLSIDYEKGMKAYKDMLERNTPNQQQLSFEDIFPKFMQTLDRVNKYLDEKEKTK